MIDPILAQAQSETRNAFQRLAFLLEAKGIISTKELAHIFEESEESAEVFRAGYVNERAAEPSECAHAVLTDEKSPVIARDSGVPADSESVSKEDG